MYKQSQSISGYILQEIDRAIWQKVAQKNIIKMVPINVQKMNVYTFQSMAEQNSDELQPQDKVQYIADLKNMKKENFLNQYITIERQTHSIPNTPKISQLRANLQKAQIKSNKADSLKNNSVILASKESTKQTRAKEESGQNFIQIGLYNPEFTIQKYQKNNMIQPINEDTTKCIEGLRNKIIFIQETKIKQRNQERAMQQKQFQRYQTMMKKKKQMQKFTFDYDGDFFGNKYPNHQSTLGSATKMKSQCNKETIKSQQIKTQKSKQFPIKIINQKLQQRYKRIKSQNQQTQNYSNFYKDSPATKLINTLMDDDNLSQGVTIKENSLNFFKNKPLNRIGQKLTLTEFKREIKGRKFKQFRVKPIQGSSKFRSKKIIVVKSEQNFLENRKNTIQVDRSEEYSDHIGNKKRYKTLFGSSDKGSLLSNSKISDGQKRNMKGLVKISNQSLFSSVFYDNEEEIN